MFPENFEHPTRPAITGTDKNLLVFFFPFKMDLCLANIPLLLYS